MPNLAIVNSEEHKHLHLRSPMEQVPHFVQIVVSEFSNAAVCCPILLAKNPETGRFYAAAMFGFKPGENLVSDVPGLGAAFRPLDVERQGFFTSGENIAVDLDSPRLSDSEGQPLFDEDGEPTDPLRRIQMALGLLVRGSEETEDFIKAIVGLRIVEPIDIALKFDDGDSIRLEGLYTISLDALGELGDAEVLKLYRSGYLHLAYIMKDSLRQIAVLAHRRNQRLAEGAIS